MRAHHRPRSPLPATPCWRAHGTSLETASWLLTSCTRFACFPLLSLVSKRRVRFVRWCVMLACLPFTSSLSEWAYGQHEYISDLFFPSVAKPPQRATSVPPAPPAEPVAPVLPEPTKTPIASAIAQTSIPKGKELSCAPDSPLPNTSAREWSKKVRNILYAVCGKKHPAGW